MNIIPASMKFVTRALLVAAFALVPTVPESVFADPYNRPSFSPRSSPSYTSPYSSSYRSPSYTSPSLPSYTYRARSRSYSVGDYSRHTYKYKDSLGNRYKSKTQVLPGGTTVTKGKYRSRSSHLSPPLPDYTYKARTNSYRVGDYHWQTYRYKDSLGNRHKGTIEVFPGGTVRHKGKVNGQKFKETYRHR